MNKVTKESIEKRIADVTYRRISEKLTHCLITLENGFQVTGESACVDPANYDQKIGEKIAYENAFNKIWEVEGYLLQDKLFHRSMTKMVDAKYPLTEKEAFKSNPAITNKEPYGKLVSAGTSQERRISINSGGTTGIDVDLNDLSAKIQNLDAHSFERLCKSLFQSNRELKKRFFELMFPNSSEHTFEALEKDLKEITHLHTDNWEYDLDFILLREDVKNHIDGFPVKNVKASYNRAGKMVQVDIRDKNVKEAIFYRMFPGATEAAFKKLESFREVYDELSFMEKAETIEIETLQGAMTYDEKMIRYNKLYRKELDLILQSLKGSVRHSHERAYSQIKIAEAIMWLGMDLKAIGTPNPYPESKNPENTVVEPTADGLKL